MSSPKTKGPAVGSIRWLQAQHRQELPHGGQWVTDRPGRSDLGEVACHRSGHGSWSSLTAPSGRSIAIPHRRLV
jgi:hypothetical protein